MKKILFVGNPNVGKSALINLIGDAGFKIANWPGVTIEKKEAVYTYQKEQYTLIDLPGIYDLTGTNEEQISVNQLNENDYDLIVNVIDVTNLKRNLLLTRQLSKLHKRIIIMLTFGDKISSVNITALQTFLGINCCLTSSKNRDQLRQIIASECLQEVKTDTIFEDPDISKVIYNASRVADVGQNLRYKKTQALDKLFLNKYLAIPLFLIIMYLLFSLIFSFTAPLTEWNQALVDLIANQVNLLLSPFSPFFADFVSFGIIQGVGNVISFIPQLYLLFLAIAFLEESGYVSRLAYIFDRLFKKFGLNGKAVISLMLGFGCSVPAVMSLRTLESKRARFITSLMIPFFSCSAKMPVYLMLIGIFFGNTAPLIIISLYAIGIIVALLIGMSANMFIKAKHSEELIMELPPYNLPRPKILFKKCNHEAKMYLKKAGGIILLAVMTIYFLGNFPLQGESILYYFAKALQPAFKLIGLENITLISSLPGAFVAKETVVAFFHQSNGTVADFNFFSELGALFSQLPQVLFRSLTFFFIHNEQAPELNNRIAIFFGSDGKEYLRAFSYLCFILLMSPCVATLAVIKKEQGLKNMIAILVITIVVPFTICLIIYNLGSIFI